MIIPPLVQAGLDKISDKVQRFDHKQVNRLTDTIYSRRLEVEGVCASPV